MVAMTRRSFLAGTAATGATLALTKPARAATVKIIREDHRVVVVGSGFGGGVTALRLAQAGVKVTVLERGRRWPTGPNAETFPHASSPDKRALWYRSAPQIFGQPVLFDPYVGLLETIGGDNITAVCAAGVGGGSLVYQGMTLQPSEAVFNEVLPEQLDWQTMNRVHYPRVAQMLGAQTAPDELINSKNYFAARVFGRNVKRSGYQLDKIPMPIDWSWALRELTGELKPSYTNGDCALGVNNGGKHSVDVTYIAAAEATGNATVLTQHEVTGVSRAPDGRWQIEVNVIDESGKTTQQKVLTAGALVMAAGTMNTSKLLMKAKQTVTDLPDGVGTGWGSNGDRIYVWSSVEDDFGAVQGGPVVYGTKDWSRPATANTVIQASLPPIGTDIRSTMMVGFGVSTGRGRFVWDSAKGEAALRFPKDADEPIHQVIQARADKIKGLGALTDTNGLANTTWHALGGAPMGTVCDLDGRVLGQRGLYVLDGALIPGSTGACNPSMTIAAVAERALENIVAKDVGVVF